MWYKWGSGDFAEICFGRQLADCSGGERLSIAGTANSESLLLAGVDICRRVRSRVQGVSCLGTGELGLRLIKNVEEMLRDGVGRMKFSNETGLSNHDGRQQTDGGIVALNLGVEQSDLTPQVQNINVNSWVSNRLPQSSFESNVNSWGSGWLNGFSLSGNSCSGRQLLFRFWLLFTLINRWITIHKAGTLKRQHGV